MKILGLSFGTKNGNNDTMCRVALGAAKEMGEQFGQTVIMEDVSWINLQYDDEKKMAQNYKKMVLDEIDWLNKEEGEA